MEFENILGRQLASAGRRGRVDDVEQPSRETIDQVRVTNEAVFGYVFAAKNCQDLDRASIKEAQRSQMTKMVGGA